MPVVPTTTQVPPRQSTGRVLLKPWLVASLSGPWRHTKNTSLFRAALSSVSAPSLLRPVLSAVSNPALTANRLALPSNHCLLACKKSPVHRSILGSSDSPRHYPHTLIRIYSKWPPPCCDQLSPRPLRPIQVSKPPSPCAPPNPPTLATPLPTRRPESPSRLAWPASPRFHLVCLAVSSACAHRTITHHHPHTHQPFCPLFLASHCPRNLLCLPAAALGLCLAATGSAGIPLACPCLLIRPPHPCRALPATPCLPAACPLPPPPPTTAACDVIPSLVPLSPPLFLGPNHFPTRPTRKTHSLLNYITIPSLVTIPILTLLIFPHFLASSRLGLFPSFPC